MFVSRRARDIVVRIRAYLIIMASLLEQLPQCGLRQDIPQSFLNVFQELYHDGRLTSWKVRGQGDILSVRLTWIDSEHRNSCIKAKARQHLGEITN